MRREECGEPHVDTACVTSRIVFLYSCITTVCAYTNIVWLYASFSMLSSYLTSCIEADLISNKSCVHLSLGTCMPLCDGAMLEESCKEAVANGSMQVAYNTPIQQYHRFLST